MQFLKLSTSLCVFSLLGLAGCAGFNGASFPDAGPNPESAPLGSISGSNFGGHAPLVGAHVYVLQPAVTSGSGTNAAAAYGALASSILNTNNVANGSNNPNAIANNNDPGIPVGWEYQLTDGTGAFNISGDYNCTVGLPVYLYLYGGSPTYPKADNNFNITNAIWSTATSGYTVTLTISTATTGTNPNPIENAYTGELFKINGTKYVSGGGGLNDVGTSQVSELNSTLQYVTATSLTTTTFSFTYPDLPSNVQLNTNYPQTGNSQVTFLPNFNTGVVNLAMLGNCPSGGFTGANAISYVYVNEVSTTATAYALAPFGPATITTSNDYANYIGTSSNNIAGVQNAAVIAKQLYDITGSQISTTYAGEGHIANKQTAAGYAGGYGIIPQANIDTIGNILAACVDSANNGSTTVVSGTPGIGYSGSGSNSDISAQCNTLFTNATSTGIPTSSTGTGANAPGIQPFDTAMAAMNMARHPAGPPNSYSSTASATFVQTLYNLPSGNRPFEPDLLSTGAGQPNDFTIGILYTAANNPGPLSGYPLTTGAESLAIDKIGNLWTTTQPAKNGSGPAYFFEFSPVGVASNIQSQTGYFYGYTTIDSGETAWAGSAQSAHAVTYVQATSTPAAAQNSAPPVYTYAAGATNTNSTAEDYTYAAIASASGNVYFGNNGAAGGTVDYIQTFAGAATTPTVTATESAAIATFATADGGITHAAIQPGGTSAYIDYNNSNGAGKTYIDSVVLSSGANNTGFPVTTATAGCASLTDPEQMAVTRSGDAIFPDYNNGGGGQNAASSSVFYITSAGACTQLSGATLMAGMYSPFGAAIDGNDYVYLTNRGGSSISVLNTSGGTAASTVAVSPSLGYIPQYNLSGTLTNMLANPLNIAAGPSGELWITDYGSNAIVEIIGLAAPTTTPLSVAAVTASATAGSIGYKP